MISCGIQNNLSVCHYRCSTYTAIVRILDSERNFRSANRLCTGIASKEHKPTDLCNDGAVALYNTETNWHTVLLGKLLVTQPSRNTRNFIKSKSSLPISQEPYSNPIQFLPSYLTFPSMLWSSKWSFALHTKLSSLRATCTAHPVILNFYRPNCTWYGVKSVYRRSMSLLH
jgi:hypothetical protein